MSPIKVVALCGSAAGTSTTERFLRVAAAHAETMGAQVDFYHGAQLHLPLYGTAASFDGAALDFLSSVAAADGVLLGSPSYHGSVSGLLKNALDYVEELRDNVAPYLHGRAVGCIAVGAGTQGPVSTLRALRDIVHALRGWPTPLGVTVDTTNVLSDAEQIRAVERGLETVTSQVVAFAAAHRGMPAPVASEPA